MAKKFNIKWWNWKKIKVIKNQGKKFNSTQVNSTNPPLATWDRDKKN
jgi:hypothetical protein